jgi:hypothetical protein
MSHGTAAHAAGRGPRGAPPLLRRLHAGGQPTVTVPAAPQAAAVPAAPEAAAGAGRAVRMPGGRAEGRP